MTTCGILGDLHLGRTLYGYDLSPGIRRIMYEFFRWCVGRQADFAVQLGDVGDKPVWSVAQQKLVLQWCNEFERAKLPLYILVGNHDVISRPGVTSALDVIKAVQFEHVHVVDRPMLLDVLGSSCLFLPFPSPSLYANDNEWRERVSAVSRASPENTTCFSHLNVEGARLGEQEWLYRGGEYDLPDLPDEVRLVVNGHIHKPQKQGRVLMTGAAELLRFDERGNKPAFYHLELPELVWERRGIRHRSRMVQLEIDVSEWTTGGAPPTTADVIKGLDELVEGCLVKVQPMVDECSAVSWADVEKYLYEQGARFVAMAPPVLVRRDADRVKAKADDDPNKAAKRFIRQRVDERSERVAILARFKQLQEQDSDGRPATPGVS